MSLNEEILKKLAEKPAENQESEPEDDSGWLIENKPLQSIAESLFHIERTMKAFLYLENLKHDTALAYRRENFYAILGGPDPEMIEKEEMERLKKVIASEQQDK